MLETASYGAAVQSWKRANPRDLLRRLIDEGATGEAELLRQLTDELLADDARDHLAVVIEYWFINNYRSLQGLRTASKAPRSRSLHAADVAAIKANVSERIQAEAAIMLREMVLPTGKTLAESSGRECACAGGWLTAVAARLNPDDIVGERLSETDLREVWASRTQ